MGESQPAFGLIQLEIQFGFLLVTQTGVNQAGDGYIAAVCHLPHGGDPVLPVHYVKFAVPEADYQRGQQAVVPLGDQAVNVLRLHRPLVGQAGSKLVAG